MVAHFIYKKGSYCSITGCNISFGKLTGCLHTHSFHINCENHDGSACGFISIVIVIFNNDNTITELQKLIFLISSYFEWQFVLV